ncbi:MAG TPA: HIT domain-containing protein [Candidatus Paceibacterota bacterium]|nr:HIT domain-containing protein [Candidatus Paceibacterota bacterium]
MKNCVFCDKEKIRYDILYETEDLFVKVGFAISAPGQVMVISNEHLPCFGAMSNWSGYDSLKKRVQQAIREGFDADPFLIEFGVWGQSVNHAHTHFIPSQSNEYRIESLVDEMFSHSGMPIEEADIDGLRGVYQKEGGYVSIEEKGQLYIVHVTKVIYDANNPFHNTRTFLNKRKGLHLPNDWRNMNPQERAQDEEKRSITKKQLTSLL